MIKVPDDSQDQKMVTEVATWRKNNDYHLKYSDREILLRESAWLNGLIVINEIRQILRKNLDFAKLTETRSEILYITGSHMVNCN